MTKDWIITDGVINSVCVLPCGWQEPNPIPCSFSFDTILLVWGQFGKEHKDRKENANATKGKSDANTDR